MRREYVLKSLGSLGLLVRFGWDPETGALDGPQAGVVRTVVTESQKHGKVISAPGRTVYRVRDPLHSEAEMALVLAQFWTLPPQLQLAHPAATRENLEKSAIG